MWSMPAFYPGWKMEDTNSLIHLSRSRADADESVPNVLTRISPCRSLEWSHSRRAPASSPGETDTICSAGPVRFNRTRCTVTDRPSHRLYRVVGIRPNGQRVPMGHGLTSDEAKQIREALVEVDVFSGITIEVDTGTARPSGPSGP